MNVNHHPEDDLLISYAAGSLAESWSLPVVAHLSHCPSCRRSIDLAETVGASLMQREAVVEMSGNALDCIMAEIDTLPQDPHASTSTISEIKSSLPQPLWDYVGEDLDNLPWQSLGGDVAQFVIKTSDREAQARLLRIKAGKSVPCHGHGGRELTLVLCGGFHDEVAVFGPGDMEDVSGETFHQPIAGNQEDCICLVVTDAPLRFRNIVPRLLQPIFKI